MSQDHYVVVPTGNNLRFTPFTYMIVCNEYKHIEIAYFKNKSNAEGICDNLNRFMKIAGIINIYDNDD